MEEYMEETKKRPRRTFTEEFKKQMVELYNAGKPRAEIVKEYGWTVKKTCRGRAARKRFAGRKGGIWRRKGKLRNKTDKNISRRKRNHNVQKENQPSDERTWLGKCLWHTEIHETRHKISGNKQSWRFESARPKFQRLEQKGSHRFRERLLTMRLRNPFTRL